MMSQLSIMVMMMTWGGMVMIIMTLIEGTSARSLVFEFWLQHHFSVSRVLYVYTSFVMRYMPLPL